MPPFSDITNQDVPSRTASLLPPKKGVLPLACLAHGNLRTRPSAQYDDCTMQDADASARTMEVESTVDNSGDDASMTLVSGQMAVSESGETTIEMMDDSATRFRTRTSRDQQSLESILKDSISFLRDELQEVAKYTFSNRTKRLLMKAIELGSNNDGSILDLEKLQYRDSSTRNISRVLGRGGFKLVLEDGNNALAVFLKKDEDNPVCEDLLAYNEILATILLSAHEMVNLTKVADIFKTASCMNFFPELTVAISMEKGVMTMGEVLAEPMLQMTRPRLNHHELDYYFFQISCALAYLHSLDLYHLDLKPSNCLLSPIQPADGHSGCKPGRHGVEDVNKESGFATFVYRLGSHSYKMRLPREMSFVKLIDLGSALPNISSYDQTISGTPSYRPPEFFLQKESSVSAGGCTDAWALALMIFEAYYGASHVKFSDEKLDEISEMVEDYLYELLESHRLCRMLYGHFVLFSTRKDLGVFSRAESIEDGWLANADPVAINFVQLLNDDENFKKHWKKYSIEEGDDASMVRLRSSLQRNSTSRLMAFLRLASIDHESRVSASEFAISTFFENMKCTDESKAAGTHVVCRLGGDLFLGANEK